MTFEFTNLQINMAILGCISKSSSVRASTGRFGLVTYSVHLYILSSLGFYVPWMFRNLISSTGRFRERFSQSTGDNHRTPNQSSNNANFNRPVT